MVSMFDVIWDYSAVDDADDAGSGIANVDDAGSAGSDGGMIEVDHMYQRGRSVCPFSFFFVFFWHEGCRGCRRQRRCGVH